MAYYLNTTRKGVSKVSTKGDGETLIIKWNRAFPNSAGNRIAYNIYITEGFLDFDKALFKQAPSFVSVSNALSAEVNDLTPGQVYRVGVRAVEYAPTSFDFALLPQSASGLHFYPESLLRESVSDTSLIIPLMGVANFPSSGIIRLGAELIAYSSVDLVNSNLLLTSPLQRGHRGTRARFHFIDGTDGYSGFFDAHAILYPGLSEEQNTVVYETESQYEYDHYAYKTTDGYRQATQDLVNANLTHVETANVGFPTLATAGYHRLDLESMLRGECIGSYMGGEYGCIDGYGVNHRVRGLSVQDANTQREEALLNATGESVALVKRQTTGIYCSCMLPQQEHPDARCLKCFGTGKVVGYYQVFSPRRSDGRIMMRFDPWIDQAPLMDSGLEVEQVKVNGAWTIVVPSIHPRDFIVRFDDEGNEEFRYEVINVTRNVLFLDQYGAQKLALNRIRKTDIIYQVPVIKDTKLYPATLQTTSVLSSGLPLHSHTIKTNESHPRGWNQLTTIDSGHNHTVLYDPETGIVQLSEELGHTHKVV